MFAKNHIGRKPFTCMGYGLFFFSFAVKVRIITPALFYVKSFKNNHIYNPEIPVCSSIYLYEYNFII